MAEGKAEAQTITVQAEGYSNLKTAEVMSQVAEKNAEAVKVEGQAEGELNKVLGSRRLYEYLNTKLQVIRAMGTNANLKIFGNSNDNQLSQMAAYRLMNNNGQI